MTPIQFFFCHFWAIPSECKVWLGCPSSSSGKSRSYFQNVRKATWNSLEQIWSLTLLMIHQFTVAQVQTFFMPQYCSPCHTNPISPPPIKARVTPPWCSTKGGWSVRKPQFYIVFRRPALRLRGDMSPLNSRESKWQKLNGNRRKMATGQKFKSERKSAKGVSSKGGQTPLQHLFALGIFSWCPRVASYSCVFMCVVIVPSNVES